MVGKDKQTVFRKISKHYFFYRFLGPGTVPIRSGSKFHAKRIYQNHLRSHMRPNSVKTNFRPKNSIGILYLRKCLLRQLLFQIRFRQKMRREVLQIFRRGFWIWIFMRPFSFTVKNSEDFRVSMRHMICWKKT